MKRPHRTGPLTKKIAQQIRAASGQLGGRTIAGAVALSRSRREARDVALPTRKNGLIQHIIPLGNHTVLPTGHTRAQNWTPDEPGLSTRAVATAEGRYSSRCQWTRYSYTQYVESWAVVANGHALTRIYTNDGVTSIRMRPWRGWHWIVDANGVALVDSSGKRDYHPTASDILSHPSTREIAELARESEKLRAESRRLDKKRSHTIKRADRMGVLVCFADSLAAGNCRAGSLNWARHHGFDIGSHYRPSELLANANGDTGRVAIVIGAAMRRHHLEMRQGFCVVADHRP